MDDATYNKLKRNLEKIRFKWQTCMGLRWWSIKFIFDRVPSDTTRPDGYFCQASTVVRWEYLSATITFNMPLLVECKDKHLEEIVVHELCHVLVNEMRQWAEDEIPVGKKDEGMKHEERVVTCMTSAFIWTMEAGEKTFTKLHPKPAKKKQKIS